MIATQWGKPYIRFRQEFESIINPLVEEIIKTFGLSQADAEDLLNRMIIFANGIAAFVITDKDSFSKEAVSRDLSQVCIGIVITDKLRDGTMDVSRQRRWWNPLPVGSHRRKNRIQFNKTKDKV